ncbi:PHP domain-containing protein [Ruminococcaceae bacterium OttesenSCG-928-I18]|nr:PHP domain-containing protein [Ruminococcaceae bacterium OttesenSCG-928-I18]
MSRDGLRYDLHIHSCLSPCAEDDMTPANIAGFAKLAGIDLMALCDHNSALNLPAAAVACEAYGVRLLAGIEVNCEEEIHLLCYFPGVEQALQMGEILYEKLPSFPYDRELWGRQLVVDENEKVLAQPEKLLTAAVSLNLYEVKALCEELSGICIPAHVDRDSSSLLSVLGFAPEDVSFEAFEVARPEHTLEALLKAGRLPPGKEILTSSDAHHLSQISEYARVLSPQSVLWRLLGES